MSHESHTPSQLQSQLLVNESHAQRLAAQFGDESFTDSPSLGQSQTQRDTVGSGSGSGGRGGRDAARVRAEDEREEEDGDGDGDVDEEEEGEDDSPSRRGNTTTGRGLSAALTTPTRASDRPARSPSGTNLRSNQKSQPQPKSNQKSSSSFRPAQSRSKPNNNGNPTSAGPSRPQVNGSGTANGKKKADDYAGDTDQDDVSEPEQPAPQKVPKPTPARIALRSNQKVASTSTSRPNLTSNKSKPNGKKFPLDNDDPDTVPPSSQPSDEDDDINEAGHDQAAEEGGLDKEEEAEANEVGRSSIVEGSEEEDEDGGGGGGGFVGFGSRGGAGSGQGGRSTGGPLYPAVTRNKIASPAARNAASQSQPKSNGGHQQSKVKSTTRAQPQVHAESSSSSSSHRVNDDPHRDRDSLPFRNRSRSIEESRLGKSRSESEVGGSGRREDNGSGSGSGNGKKPAAGNGNMANPFSDSDSLTDPSDNEPHPNNHINKHVNHPSSPSHQETEHDHDLDQDQQQSTESFIGTNERELRARGGGRGSEREFESLLGNVRAPAQAPGRGNSRAGSGKKGGGAGVDEGSGGRGMRGVAQIKGKGEGKGKEIVPVREESQGDDLEPTQISQAKSVPNPSSDQPAPAQAEVDEDGDTQMEATSPAGGEENPSSIPPATSSVPPSSPGEVVVPTVKRPSPIKIPVQTNHMDIDDDDIVPPSEPSHSTRSQANNTNNTSIRRDNSARISARLNTLPRHRRLGPTHLQTSEASLAATDVGEGGSLVRGGETRASSVEVPLKEKGKEKQKNKDRDGDAEVADPEDEAGEQQDQPVRSTPPPVTRDLPEPDPLEEARRNEKSPNVYGKRKGRKPSVKARENAATSNSASTTADRESESSPEPEAQDDSTYRPVALTGDKIKGKGKAAEPSGSNANGRKTRAEAAAVVQTRSNSRRVGFAEEEVDEDEGDDPLALTAENTSKKGKKRPAKEAPAPKPAKKPRTSVATKASTATPEPAPAAVPAPAPVPAPIASGSGTSGPGPMEVDPAEKHSRVFARWTDKNYYPGTVRGLAGKRVEIDFDDDTRGGMEFQHVRLLRLKVGDIVEDVTLADEKGKGKSKVNRREVTVVGCDNAGDYPKGQMIRVKHDGEEYLQCLTDIRIKKDHLAQMEDRKLSLESLQVEDQPTISRAASLNNNHNANNNAKLVPGSPLRQVSAQSSPRPVKRESNVFAGVGFLISSPSTKEEAKKKKLRSRIMANGGYCGNDVWDFYEEPTTEALKEGYRAIKPKSGNITAVYLIMLGGPSTTPKFLMALALGIPCLSSHYIEEAIENPLSHWSGYLISSGWSHMLEAECSQVVDMRWGKDVNIMKKPLDNETITRRPFWGKDFMVVQKSMAPVVPFCIAAMGADSVTVVPSYNSNTTDPGEVDVIVFADNSVPDAAYNLRQTANTEWMKQCLVMGRYSPPRCYNKQGG